MVFCGTSFSRILNPILFVEKACDELQLTPDIIYSLPTDNAPVGVVKGTNDGRIFLGGKDGNLYEIVYRVSDTCIL